MERKNRENWVSCVDEAVGRLAKEETLRPKDLGAFCKELRVLFGVETEPSREVLNSLEASQFRAKVEGGGQVLVYDRRRDKGSRWVPLADRIDPSSCKSGEGEFEDRTYGVFILVGPERFKKLVEFAHRKGKGFNLPRLVSKGVPQEGTQGRGILQTAADLLLLSTLKFEKEGDSDEAREILGKINSRILKYLNRKYKDNQEKLEELRQRFEGVPAPLSTTSSFPPDLFGQLIGVLSIAR